MRAPSKRWGEPLVAGPGSDCADGEPTKGDTERLEAPRFLLGGANCSAAMINKCVSSGNEYAIQLFD